MKEWLHGSMLWPIHAIPGKSAGASGYSSEVRPMKFKAGINRRFIYLFAAVLCMNAVSALGGSEIDAGIVYNFDVAMDQNLADGVYDTGVQIVEGEAYLVLTDGFWYRTGDPSSSSRIHSLEGNLQARVGENSWFRINDSGTRDWIALASGRLYLRIDPAVDPIWTDNTGQGVAVIYNVVQPFLTDAALPSHPSGLNILHASPNPFNPSVTFEVAARKAMDVDLRVLDSRGRVVVDLGQFHHPGGNKSFTWDGLDKRSSSVASGVYFIEASGDGESSVFKVTMIK